MAPVSTLILFFPLIRTVHVHVRDLYKVFCQKGGIIYYVVINMLNTTMGGGRGGGSGGMLLQLKLHDACLWC